jgi:hypothetical protein
MNTWQHVSIIDVNAYCTWLQDEITSPLGDTSCFALGYFINLMEVTLEE